MGERGLLRGGLADVVAADGAGGDARAGVLLRVLDDLAGLGVDVVFVLHIACVELDLVDHDAVLAVEVGLDVDHIACADARMGVGCGLGLVDAYIALGAGGAGLADGGITYAAGACDEADVVHREGSQGFGGEGRVGGTDLEDEFRLALGDAVLLREGCALAGGGDGLGQYRGLKAAVAHGAADEVADLLLQALGLCAVAVFDGDEDGVADVVKVAVHEHGADEGVYGDVEARARKIHIADDGFGVVVEGLHLEDLIALVHDDVEAGVNIQGDDRGDAVLSRQVCAVCIAQSEVSAEAHQHEGGRHGYGEKAIFLLFDFVHRYYISFPGFAGFEDAGQLIRGRVLGKAANALFYLLVIHHSASSAAFPSFFMAR